MPVYTKTAAQVFAPTNGSGQPRGANMGEAQTWGTEIETAVEDLDDEFGAVEVSTDGTLASNSDAKLPTEKAVKTAIAYLGTEFVMGTETGQSSVYQSSLTTKYTTGYPVLQFVPETAATAIAVDIIPRGNPTGENGVLLSQAWLDIVNGGDAGFANTLRMSIGLDAAWIVNARLGVSAEKPLIFGITVTKYMTIDPVNDGIECNKPIGTLRLPNTQTKIGRAHV